MVKPDIKHNYYADLELPASASLEDIRKAYRKLALQYHPDRNSGREGEVVPKFQAIQAASEVLCDPAAREKYDTDRRKAGFLSSFTPRSGTPNNPYAATSAYPPPPRRTQPSAWPRPQSGGAPPNGAERFSNFPRPTAKKDPTQERANAFNAWKNMNNADRQRPSSGPQPPTQPPSATQPQNRQSRPQPPPRSDPRMPADDSSRPGMKYKVPPPFDMEGADKRSSAWASFRQGNAGKPGMPTGNAFRTPNKTGFNPNAPGSDEKAAPGADRQRSAYYNNNDFAGQRQQPNSQSSASAASPTSPNSQRPYPNPQRPFSGRLPDDQVPFAEGNRERTPYTRSFHRDDSGFLREGLRRSHSHRDTTKLSPENGGSATRARSSSPPRASPEPSQRQNAFEADDSSNASEADVDSPPEEFESSASQNHQQPESAPSENAAFNRPKKRPTAPSRRFGNATANGAQSDTDLPQTQPNMYDQPPSSCSSSSSSLPFDPHEWTQSMFGSDSTSSETPHIPLWAIPSSVYPGRRSSESNNSSQRRRVAEEYVAGADPVYINATLDEQFAFLLFQNELDKDYGECPGNLDMDVFLMLVAQARRNESTGDELLDSILKRVLQEAFDVPSASDPTANSTPRANRFDFAHNPEAYKSAKAKSRSEERIDTTFSPDGWPGEFTGQPDYFAPPSGTQRNTQPSAGRANATRNGTPQQRSSTLDVPTPGGPDARYEEVQQRAWGSDGTPSDFPRTAAPSAGFDQEQWQQKFQDSTWTWPPPPPNPSSPGKSGRKQSQSRKAGKTRGKHGVQSDYDDSTEIRDNSTASEPVITVEEPEAMDIDDTPPSQPANSADQESTARMYSMPPSEWRQQQEHQRFHHKASRSSKGPNRAAANHAATKFNASLDDLRNVAPFASQPSPGEPLNVADMESALPFQSQASGDPMLPRDLQMPSLPIAPTEPQCLSRVSWQGYATAFGQYVKEFHKYNDALLQHFLGRERQAQDQISKGMSWLEATGDTSGMLTAPTGFGTYLRGMKEDRKVREASNLAWERHNDAVMTFEKIRDRVRKLVVGGMLLDQ